MGSKTAVCGVGEHLLEQIVHPVGHLEEGLHLPLGAALQGVEHPGGVVHGVGPCLDGQSLSLLGGVEVDQLCVVGVLCPAEQPHPVQLAHKLGGSAGGDTHEPGHLGDGDARVIGHQGENMDLGGADAGALQVGAGQTQTAHVMRCKLI